MQSMEMLGIFLLFIVLISSHAIHTFGQQVFPQSETANAINGDVENGFPPIQPLNTHSSSFGTRSTGIPEFPGATSTGQPVNNQMQNGFQQGYQIPQQQQTGYPQQNLNPQTSSSSSAFNQLPFAKISNQPGIGNNNNNNPFFNSANSGEVGSLFHLLPPLIIATMGVLF